MTSGTSSPLRTWRAETLTATPRSVSRQGGDGGAGLAQHPAAEVGDQRRFLGQRHELGGGDVAEQRVPPAQQRLDGDGAVHDDVDDGLEDQPQLAAVQRAVEVGAQGVAAVLLDAQGVVVAVHGAGAGGAGAAQGEVAAAQRLTGVDVGQQGGDAGDGGQLQGAAGDGQRADGGDQAGGHGLGVGDAAVDEDDEVAVLAAGQPVLAAQGAGQPGGEGAEDGGLGLGGRAPRRRGRRCRSAARAKRAPGFALHGAEPADQRGPVGQPGDGVGEGELGQLGVEARGGDAGGDVAAVQDERADVGVGAQVADGGLDQPPAAVGVRGPGRCGRRTRAVGRRCVQGGEQGGAVVGVDGVGDAAGRSCRRRRARRRSATASEAKVTRSLSSRMTTGSTLLFTSVRNEDWLRCRSPVELPLAAHESDLAGAEQDGEAASGDQQAPSTVLRGRATAPRTADDGDHQSRGRRGARRARFGARPGTQPRAAPGRGRSSHDPDRDPGSVPAASLSIRHPSG